MDQQEDQLRLQNLLRRQAPDLSGKTRFCPDDAVFAAWHEGRLDESRTDPVLQHVQQCKYCQARTGIVSRLGVAEESGPVDGDMLATARRMGQGPPTGRRIAPWAAAAVLALAISTYFGIRSEPVTDVVTPPGVTPDTGQPRQVRSLDAGALRLEVISPSEGQRVDPFDLSIRWTDVPGVLYYELTVMSDAGDPVLNTRTRDNTWSGAPGEMMNRPGEYFLLVEAHKADATRLSSSHVVIVVSPASGNDG